MTTALDSNVIVALLNDDDSLNLRAQKALREKRSLGNVAICGAVYAELLAMPGRSETFVDGFCEDAGIIVEWELSEKIWRTAGKAFQDYARRRRKGRSGEPRRILADFLIGAHAAVQGYRLLTLDARIYEAAFPGLAITTV